MVQSISNGVSSSNASSSTSIQSQRFSSSSNPLLLLANSLLNGQDLSPANYSDKNLWKTCHRLFAIPSVKTMIEKYISANPQRENSQTSDQKSGFKKEVKALGQDICRYYQELPNVGTVCITRKSEKSLLKLLNDYVDDEKEKSTMVDYCITNKFPDNSQRNLVLSCIIKDNLCELADKAFTKEMVADISHLNDPEDRHMLPQQTLQDTKKLLEENTRQLEEINRQPRELQEGSMPAIQPGFIQTHLNSLLEAIYSVLRFPFSVGKAILAYITSALSSFLHFFKNLRGQYSN